MYMVYVWLGIIVAGLIFEAVEAGTLVSIWFSLGAVIPLIMSFFGINEFWFIALEAIIFGVTTVLCLVFLRKIVKKTLYKNSNEKTNMEEYIGKKYKISRVDGDISYIKLNGVEYRVVDDDGESMQLNDVVVVLKIKGNKIIVDKFNKEKGEN